MSEESTPAPGSEPRPRIQHALFDRTLTPRGAARLIASASLLITVTGGLAIWLLDKKEIGSLGDAFWWALQTVTTVGYGDIVPENTIGRLIGALLMLNGIALVSVVTAAVTATLIEQARRRHASSEEDARAALARIEARLARIEAQVGAGPGRPDAD